MVGVGIIFIINDRLLYPTDFELKIGLANLGPAWTSLARSSSVWFAFAKVVLL